MAIEQLTLDGESLLLTPQGVMDVTREVMREKPVTYRSHRLLMVEIAKRWGVNWKAIPPAEQRVLEKLFDLSPDIERAARKVREEDGAIKKAATTSGFTVREVSNEEDPFEAIKRKNVARHRGWKR